MGVFFLSFFLSLFAKLTYPYLSYSAKSSSLPERVYTLRAMRE